MKKAIFALVAVFLLALLAGCTNTPTTPISGPNDNGNDIQSQDKETPGEKPAPAPEEPALKTDSGRYVGRIDNNSIEIKISGVPDEIAAKAFRLSEKVKAELDSYQLQTGDVVKFNYILNEHNQPVISHIEKIGSN